MNTTPTPPIRLRRKSSATEFVTPSRCAARSPRAMPAAPCGVFKA